MDLSILDDQALRLTGFLLKDLDEETQALFKEVGVLKSGAALLRLLRSRANALLAPEDLAYHLNLPEALICDDLNALFESGWVERLDRAGCCWFTFSPDPRRREIVRRLFVWQDRWYAHLDSVRMMVNGSIAEA